MADSDLIERLAELVGSDTLTITDASTRWPALGDLSLGDRTIPVSLYAGVVGGSQRGRDDVERRFQNLPGGRRWIRDERPQREALLLGLLTDDDSVAGEDHIDVTRPLLVAADPYGRVGKTSRYSVFASVSGLKEALRTGWSERVHAKGELIQCFVPSLLGPAVAARLAGARPAAASVQAAVAASGILDTPAAAVRVRRAVSVLVRDARFSGWVLDAYQSRCAMCGLGAGLVEAAHINPASAPGSVDAVWNGIALCANHHRAFDRHLIAVEPGTLTIRFSPALQREAASDPAARTLIDMTFGRLAPPRTSAARPRATMFVHRYENAGPEYAWL